MKPKRRQPRTTAATRELARLRARLAEAETRCQEAEETLRAIRHGEVDALIVATPQGDQVFSLQGAETTYRFLVEEMNEGALLLGPDGTILYANTRFARLAETPLEQVIGAHWERYFLPDEREDLQHLLRVAQATSAQQELHLQLKQNARRPVAVSISSLHRAQVHGFSVVITDLTERKAAEAALGRANQNLEKRVQIRTAELLKAQVQLLQLYRTLQAHNACSRAMLTAHDEPAFLNQVCQIVTDTCGYPLIWIGLAEPDAASSVRVAAAAGFEDYHLERLRITWADNKHGQGSTGRAIRTGKPQLCANLEAEPHMAPWTAAARPPGLVSALVLPLLAADKAFGTMTIYGPKPNAFSEEEIGLLSRLADDVAQGVVTLRLREAHAQAENALRASEEQFRILANSLPALAWWTDSEGNVIWYNQRWYDYTGTTPEQMEGSGWQSVFDPKILPEVLHRWKHCLATGEPFEMEFPLRGADGISRWFLTRSVPLRGVDGKILRWLGTNTDITDEREARLVLTRSKEDLERLVAERTAKLQELVGELEHFSYTITHDMRAPLRAMQGFGELVLEFCEPYPEPEPKALLRRIIDSAQRMDLLITDALSYSKAVRQHLPLGPVDVGALLRGMLDTYPELQNVRRHIELQGSFPLVLANQAGLTQCFSNLLGNAIKFVKPGHPPTIRIWAESLPGSASATEPADGHGAPEKVRIWVEDQGIGIPEAMLPRIFNMFARGSRAYEGTGIGLALVRKVVNRMGGRIGVESELGKGSRFWIELLAGDPRVQPLTVLPPPPPDIRTLL